jgi:hypothetical protein
MLAAVAAQADAQAAAADAAFRSLSESGYQSSDDPAG